MGPTAAERRAPALAPLGVPCLLDPCLAGLAEAAGALTCCLLGSSRALMRPLPAPPSLVYAQPPDHARDPQVKEAHTLVARKRLQLEHMYEYDQAIVGLKAKVKEAEGQDMREAIQDKVGAGWAGG